jgi:hypothetical protein
MRASDFSNSAQAALAQDRADAERPADGGDGVNRCSSTIWLQRRMWALSIGLAGRSGDRKASSRYSLMTDVRYDLAVVHERRNLSVGLMAR